MSEEKKPFERNMLRQLTEKKYIRKMEYIIIEEGKKILNSLKVGYMIVADKQIHKFLLKHPDFIGTRWHQVGMKSIFEYKLINTFQYQHLIMMKQALNKNGMYILRKDEFENRKFANDCDRYHLLKSDECKDKICFQDSCIAKKVCPIFYQNTKEWRDKQKEKK